MGTVSDFPTGLPDGGSREFAEAVWDSIPRSMQVKFSDPAQIDKFLAQIEDSLDRLGLRVTNVSIGIDPDTSESVLHISAMLN